MAEKHEVNNESVEGSKSMDDPGDGLGENIPVSQSWPPPQIVLDSDSEPEDQKESSPRKEQSPRNEQTSPSIDERADRSKAAENRHSEPPPMQLEQEKKKLEVAYNMERSKSQNSQMMIKKLGNLLNDALKQKDIFQRRLTALEEELEEKEVYAVEVSHLRRQTGVLKKEIEGLSVSKETNTSALKTEREYISMLLLEELLAAVESVQSTHEISEEDLATIRTTSLNLRSKIAHIVAGSYKEDVAFQNRLSQSIEHFEVPPSTVEVRKSDPTKAGFVAKQGGFVKNWKKRWFVLYGRRIDYFKSPQAVSKKSPLGRIDLDETVVASPSFAVPGHCFEIHTPNRKYLCVCDTKDELSSWVTTINDVVKLGRKFSYADDEPTRTRLRKMSQGAVGSFTSSKSFALSEVRPEHFK